MNDAHDEPTAAFVPVWDDDTEGDGFRAAAATDGLTDGRDPAAAPRPRLFDDEALEPPAAFADEPAEEADDAVAGLADGGPPTEAMAALEVEDTEPEAMPSEVTVARVVVPTETVPPAEVEAAPVVLPTEAVPPAEVTAAPVVVPTEAVPPARRPDLLPSRATTGSGTLRSTVSEPVTTTRAAVKKRPSRALVRVRSVVTLVAVVLVSGVALAAAIGVVLAAIGLLLRRAAGG